jgi:hypothetical protein
MGKTITATNERDYRMAVATVAATKPTNAAQANKHAPTSARLILGLESILWASG